MPSITVASSYKAVLLAVCFVFPSVVMADVDLCFLRGGVDCDDTLPLSQWHTDDDAVFDRQGLMIQEERGVGGNARDGKAEGSGQGRWIINRKPTDSEDN